MNADAGQVAIYYLVDPRKPDLVRYVGQSATPRVRHLQHCAETCASRKGHWIESLRAAGIMPQMVIAEWVESDRANERERELIKANRGELLCNSSYRHDASGLILEPLEEQRRSAVIAALRLTGWNKQEASRRLKIGRQTLYNLIARYSIPTPDSV